MPFTETPEMYNAAYTVHSSDNIGNISCIMQAWAMLWNSPRRHKFASQSKHQNVGCEPCNRPCFWSSPAALYSHRKDSAPQPLWLSFEGCLLQNWYLKEVNLSGKLSARWKSLTFSILCTVTGFSWWNHLYCLSVGNGIGGQSAQHKKKNERIRKNFSSSFSVLEVRERDSAYGVHTFICANGDFSFT